MPQLNASTWNGYVNLVTVDLTAYGDSIYGFIDSHNGITALNNPGQITWNGQVFDPLPMSLSGFSREGENKAEPTVSVPDFGAPMFVTLMKYGLACGAPVTRYQALAADVLANDPHAPFLTEMYLLKNVSFDGMTLQLKLATHLDYTGAQFPAHVQWREEYPGLGSVAGLTN